MNQEERVLQVEDREQINGGNEELDILKNNYEYLSTYKRKLYKMYEREKFDLTSEFEEHTEIYRNVGNKIGIIGGTGLNDPSNKILKSRSEIKQEDAKNEFGLPSSNIYEGTINGVDVALLSRHGTNHTITPTNVNYRANIEALRLVGCTHILACTASGSLSESIDRGQLVIPDSYINRTIHRKGTFYDGTSKTYSGTCHVPMEPAFDPRTSQILETAASKLNIPIRKGGTIVTIEGPAFSSKAESKMFRLCGAHLINMTTCPEVSLAKEAGLLYAVVAIATDYDCWRDGEDVLSTVDIIELLKKNIDKVVKILIEAVELINQESWDEYIDDLKNLLVSCNVSHV